MMDFDVILDHLGHFGKFQFGVMMLACLAQILGGMQMRSSLFLFPMDKVELNSFRCYIPECDKNSSQYLEHFVHFAIPNVTDNFATTLSSCERFGVVEGRDDCEPHTFNSSHIVPCTSYIWDHAEHENPAISDFHMLCKKSRGAKASNLIFSSGMLSGSLGFGMIADKFGRKKVMLSATLIMIISSIGTVFAPGAGFSFFRFISAATVAGLFQTGFILGVEFIGTTKRLLCANIMQIVFVIGQMVLSLLAYLIKKWKPLQLAISVPALIMLIYFWLLPESVRWLISKGRHSDARKTILKAAKWNNAVVPEHLLRATEYSNDGIDYEQHQQSSGPMSLVTSPQMRKWNIYIVLIWFSNALVFYGISLSAKSLTGSPYGNFAVLTAIEIPILLFATWVLSYFGRRVVLSSVMIGGGLVCLSMLAIPQALGWVSTLLIVLVKSTTGAALAIFYIYSAEIYPTGLRSTGIGLSCMFAGAGGMIGPVIHSLRKVHPLIPLILFGVASIASGILTLLLPETNNRQLPESIEETVSSSLSNGYERLMNRPRHLPNIDSISPRVPRRIFDEGSRLLGHC